MGTCFWARAHKEKGTHAKMKYICFFSELEFRNPLSPGASCRCYARKRTQEVFGTSHLSKFSLHSETTALDCATRENRIDARYKLFNPTEKECRFSKESIPSWKKQTKTEHLAPANYYKKEENGQGTNISRYRTPWIRHKSREGTKYRSISLVRSRFFLFEIEPMWKRGIQGTGWNNIAFIGENITLILSDLPRFSKRNSLRPDFYARGNVVRSTKNHNSSYI